MPFPSVKSCGCLSLRTGGLFIGVVAIFLDLSSIFAYFLVKTDPRNKQKDNAEGIFELVLTGE